MKNLLFFALAATLFTGCKKDSSDNNGTPDAPPYINSNSGSIWLYHQINNSTGTPVESDYTVTSTARDTTIESKTFHIYGYSFGGFQYLNQSNSDYYQFDSLPVIGNALVRLYLKTNLNVGKSWTQDISVPVPNLPTTIPVRITNKIADKDSRTVNGIAYENVIHVQTTLSSSLIPSDALNSAIDMYYAPGYGLIESSVIVKLDYMGMKENVNIKSTLTSAVLK